jgi:hypothetical protein
VQDFVPKGHVSRFIVELVRESLDLKEIMGSYVSGLGQPPFDPRMMVALLLHGYPATAGRHCRSGARQSTPSISIDNCAEVSISVPPGSTFDGHRNTPCSSRLVKRQRPLPSQYTILMRLAQRVS